MKQKEEEKAKLVISLELEKTVEGLLRRITELEQENDRLEQRYKSANAGRASMEKERVLIWTELERDYSLLLFPEPNESGRRVRPKKIRPPFNG